jgi:dienelactone hydrolase
MDTITGRREWLFLGATSLVALRVVDDNFLQPRFGSSWHDHVASGLVPLALMALGAWAYLRVRAGAGAVIAIALGLFGLVVATIEPLYYTSAVGLSADELTGLLAIPAALVLLGVGFVGLWTSRRQTPNRPWRYARRVLLTLAGLATAYTVFLPIGVAYMATHVARAEVPPPNLGAAYEDVTLHTSDDLTLRGWYVPSRNGAAVIAFPGRKGTQEQTRMLVEHGYGVLLFDRRGEGVSEGDGNMFGWNGERDIFAALDYLEQRPDVDPGRIGGVGLSVGGELMLQAAAEDDRLAAVVSEGAGTRTFAEEMEEYDGFQRAIGTPLLAIKTAAVAAFSNTAPPPKLTDLVTQIAPRPTLFIWAPNGGNVEWMNPEYHRLAGPNSSIWEIPDAQHIRGLATHPQEYEKRVVGFFDEALLH